MPNRYRSIFLSDVHLGTAGSQPQPLVRFLQENTADYLYLVGDIVDGWALSQTWFWEAGHNAVVRELLRWAEQACVVYIPGNHDAFARAYDGLHFGGIHIRGHAIHTLSDGRQFLVLHGDEFDEAVRCASWEETLWKGWRWLQQWVGQACAVDRWSLAVQVQQQPRRYLRAFEAAVAAEAARYEVDGIICGHVHQPKIRTLGDVTYANAGDWVAHCSSLVEHLDGRLEVRRCSPAGGAATPGAARAAAGRCSSSID